MKLRLKGLKRTTSTVLGSVIAKGKAQTDKKRVRLGLAARSALFLLFVLVPSLSFAQIQITEIMYDAPGSDSGREWIEVTNVGNEAIDIAKYKLFENNTNHGLKVVSGVAILAPNASAIIAADAAKFRLDWPSFSGTLFDSTFALSNTGEELSFKNASSSVLDVAAYTSDMGAAGDTSSLHRQGNTFVAALPTPGIYPGELVKVAPKPAPTKTTTTKTSTSKSSNTAKNKTNSEQPTFVPVQNTAASVESLPSSIPNFVWWALALAGVIAVGITGLFFIQPTSPDTQSLADEFKID